MVIPMDLVGLDETTFSQHLKDSEYATHAVGE